MLKCKRSRWKRNVYEPKMSLENIRSELEMESGERSYCRTRFSANVKHTENQFVIKLTNMTFTVIRGLTFPV